MLKPLRVAVLALSAAVLFSACRAGSGHGKIPVVASYAPSAASSVPAVPSSSAPAVSSYVPSGAVSSAVSKPKASNTPKPFTQKEITEAVKQPPMPDDPGDLKTNDPSLQDDPEDGGNGNSQTPSLPTISSPSSTPSTPSSSPSSSFSSLSSSFPAVSTPSSASSAVMPDGWQTIGGGRYYYQNGAPITGWWNIDNRRYNFNASGRLITRTGIDVSKYQATINWNAVKNSGIDFAMIRAGVRGYGTEGNMQEDPYFKLNYNGATTAGLPVGIYFYSQAVTVAEGVEEAQKVLSYLGGHPLDLPIAFDTEDPGQGRLHNANLSKQAQTDIAIAFCDTVKGAGYQAMVYASKNWYETKLDFSRLSPYQIWLAHHTTLTNFSGGFKMWQYSSVGSVGGISGDVDMDVMFE